MNQDPCSCDKCGDDLCPGDVICGTCGSACDPDATKGFRIKRPVTRGDTIEIEYALVDKNGAPIDASAIGTKLWFTVKDYLGRPDVQAVWQGTYLAGIAQDSVGKIRVTVPPTATLQVPDGIVKLYYDLQLKDSSARITTIEKGIFEFAPDVTRAIS